MVERRSGLSEALEMPWKLSERHWEKAEFGKSVGQAGVEMRPGVLNQHLKEAKPWMKWRMCHH